MGKHMGKLIILLTFLIGQISYAKIKKLPPQEGIPLVLGMGYSTDWETFTLGECVTGTPFYDGQNQAFLDFKTKIEYKELQKQLGLNAGFRYKKGFTTVSASASFLKASKSNSYSVSAVYNGSYKFKDQGVSQPILSANGMSLVNKPEQWSKTCGDYYTFAKSYGGKIFFSIRIDFKSKEAKDKFSARFNFTSPMTDVSASIDKFKKEFSQKTEVKVSALQLGGDVTKLSNIFNGSTVVNSSDASYSFVKCSFGKFNDCQTVLKNAISYVTHDFPTQFKKMEDDSVVQLRPNASLMGITLVPYTSAGIHVGFSSQMTKQIKQTRKEMEKEFDLVLGQFQRSNSILDNIAIVKSPRQANKLTEMKAKLYGHMEKMVEAAEICLDDPLECALEYKNMRLAGPTDLTGFKLYHEDDFKIELETFAQYCDFGLSPWSTEELSNTVKHLINISKFEDELRWNNLKKQNFSQCYISEQILQEIPRLDLSFDRLSMLYNDKAGDLEFDFPNLYDHRISNLKPLMTFKHWKGLNLANHKIATSDEFVELPRLESLELRGNRLYEVLGLVNMPELRYLGLSANDILTADLLVQMVHLELVDLSNNLSVETCPLPESSRCLLFDLSTNNQLFSIHRPLNIRRWGHTSIALNSGDVLITGGAGDKKARQAEIYDEYMGQFKKIGNMLRARYEHRMDLLFDGRVLVTGGWSALNSAEIYNPKNQKFEFTKSLMQNRRADHSSVVLNSGDVLLTGGYTGQGGLFTGLDASGSAEVFQVATNTFKKLPSMKVPRAGHSLTKLPDGRVVAIGGFHPRRSLNSIEVYNPKTKSFRFFNSRLQEGRGYHSAHLMDNGKIVILGGYTRDAEATDTVEVFDPYSDRIQRASFSLNHPRGRHMSLLLEHGGILVIGGDMKFVPSLTNHSSPKNAHLSAEMIDIRINRSSVLRDPLAFERVDASAVHVGRKRVLITGGEGPVQSITAELFEY
jgi:hypothetical protein